MDKNAIKKYAVWARNELIARVSQKAQQYGITEKNIVDAKADSVNGILLSDTEKKQRQALIKKIEADGYEQVMEEVAYTWFNRFTALRFMEVNNYLPSHTRVFTNEDNEFKPQILAEAISLDLDGLDMDKVFALKDANKDEELYKYLLIVQCNALSSVLPGMFQKIADYTELLLPDYLLREGSVIEQMITQIPEDNFDVNTDNGQIEIIGWLYQYYISERHEEVVDPLHGKVVKKEEVPAATQLFTTDWVVRYIVDNTVGRYWIERNPQSNLADSLEYFAISQNGNLPTVLEDIRPEDLTVFDPAVGSGHFLVYAFDVLMKIYAEYGYSDREAASLIAQNNLYGLDIDARAVQLAYFAVMMKGRQHDSRFFRRGIQPHIFEITESNMVDAVTVEYFCSNDEKMHQDIKRVLNVMKDAKEYGSILDLSNIDFKKIFMRFDELKEEINILNPYIFGEFKEIINSAWLLSKKYVAVVTNPPYLNKYDSKLKDYIVSNYNDYKGDLFSVFIYKNLQYCVKDGYAGFMTPFVWMFIKTYAKLREYIIQAKSIITLIQMEYSAFEEATVPICSFVLKNGLETYNGLYFRLSDFTGGMEVQRTKVMEALSNPHCGYRFETPIHHYDNIPGKPLAYWVSKKFVDAFANENIAKYSISDGQTKTGDNNKYLRNLWEVDVTTIGKNHKWALIAKGGNFRRWSGNIDTVIDWSEGARRHYKEDHVARIAPEYIWFRKGVCWNHITSGTFFAARYISEEMLFETAAPAIFFDDEELLYYVIGYLNSPVSCLALRFINPTISTNVGDITSQPLIIVLRPYQPDFSIT